MKTYLSAWTVYTPGDRDPRAATLTQATGIVSLAQTVTLAPPGDKAQDADGVWWGYVHEPNLSDTSWYENEVGRYIRLTLTEPNAAWRTTLTRRQA